MNVVKNKSGIILITVLWILAILSLLALSLSKGASLELSLIRNSVGKVKAYAAARAGISYAQHLLAKSETDKDTLYQCGIKFLTGQTPSVVFKGIKVDNDTHFDILFSGALYGFPKKEFYGLEDEQGKINLNAIDGNNYIVLSKLLQQFDMKEGEANNLAAAVIDWHTEGDVAFRSPQGNVQGAKDDYYMNQLLPYKCKNKPFDRIEEVLLVRGMTEDLFKKIKDYLTVFPKNVSDGIKVNFNTASDAVINALVEGASSGIVEEDVKQAFILLRNGRDNIPLTVDDGVDKNMSMFSATQQLYMNSLRSSYGIEVSTFFRVTSVGVDESTGIKCKITSVVHKLKTDKEVSLVSWERN
jgi:type II secretory pathway component PulK